MSIQVVLIRHAKASLQNVSQNSLASLSPEGRRVQKEMDSYLKARRCIPTEVWHSPVLRATQTAEVIAEDFHVPLRSMVSLSEFFDELDILSNLAEVPAKSSIFLVSHGPQLMRLASFLVGLRVLKAPLQNSSALILEFPEAVSEGKARFVRLFTHHDALLNKNIKF